MQRLARAQVSLELALVFVALLGFLLGMLRIFFLANNDLVARQNRYLETRDERGRWPIYDSRPLSDDAIFRGRF